MKRSIRTIELLGITGGHNPRPIPVYQQIVVALHVLGGGVTGDKARIALNIGYGTVWTYI